MKIDNSHVKKLREQENLAEANQATVEDAVVDYQLSVENRGHRIDLENLPPGALSAASRIRCFWHQRTRQDCHTIQLVGRHKPWLLLHRVAQAVALIELECLAEQAGTRKTHCSPRQNFQRVLSQFIPAKKDNQRLLKKLLDLSYSVPLEIVTEVGLTNKFPALEPAQFLDLHRSEAENARDFSSHGAWKVSPELLLALESLQGVRALFVDRRFGSTIEHFARFRGSPAAARAEEMYVAVEAHISSNPRPGDHYSLVDRVTGIAGLHGLHDWDTRPVFELEALVGAGVGASGTFLMSRPPEDPWLE